MSSLSTEICQRPELPVLSAWRKRFVPRFLVKNKRVLGRSFLCGPLCISTFSAFNCHLYAEAAKIHRGPQRKPIRCDFLCKAPRSCIHMMAGANQFLKFGVAILRFR